MPSEPLRAHVSKEWKRRIWMIAAFIFAASSWFLYDGLFGYPKNNERAEVYLPLKEQYEDDKKQLETEWAEIQEARGWSGKTPKKIYSDQDILTQYLFAAFGYLGFLGTLGYYFWSLPRTLAFSEDKLTLPDGRVIDIYTIKNIDKRAWKSKGIAKVRYQVAPGKMEKAQLDDYKFIGTAEILDEIQARLQPKKAE